MTRTLPPSTLEIALLQAVEEARAGQQREIAVSLSMMLESLRRQNEDKLPSARFQGLSAQA